MFKTKNILLLCVLLVQFRLSLSTQEDCPSVCSCRNGETDCSGNLTTIPPIPFETTEFKFSCNFLPSVSNDTFGNISTQKIKSLVLQRDYIQFISEFTFQNFSSLTKLDLSNNALTEIKGSMFTDILTVLNLKNNKIKSMDYFGLSGLRELKFSRNNLVDIPDFCNTIGHSYVPSMKKIDFDGNLITDISKLNKHGKCATNLKTLILSRNPIREFPNNAFAQLKSLKDLSLDRICARTTDIAFNEFTFNITSLERLSIRNNIFFNFSREYYKNIFSSCPNLKYLIMKDISLQSLDRKDMFALFTPLRDLREVNLDSTSIIHIPENFFSKFSNLTSVLLSRNYISGWTPSTFEGVHSLKSINLKLNEISLVNQTSFPPETWKNLDHVDISFNPFSCICDLEWFINWIKSNGEKIKNLEKNYYCYSPSSVKNLPLTMFSLEECRPPISPYIVFGICLVVFGAIIATIAYFIYKYRMDIKYHMYVIRSKEIFRKRRKSNAAYKYDAFVAYNSNDRFWVLANLIPSLEINESMHLCLHERDFEVGKPIVDNVFDYLHKSRKSLLILTNNFVNSNWCRFELLIAQNRLLEEGLECMVVVKMEDIEEKNITPSLRSLLSNVTYIEWTRDKTEQELFWRRLVQCMKKK